MITSNGTILRRQQSSVVRSTQLRLSGGPLDGLVADVVRPARMEVFLLGEVPVGATLTEFERALSSTGAAHSPQGRRALSLLAERASAARYRAVGPMWRRWRRVRRYLFVDEQLLWVEQRRDGPALGLVQVPDFPPQ